MIPKEPEIEEEEKLVFKFNLPRPKVINLTPSVSNSQAQQLIDEEIKVLLIHDNIRKPFTGMKVCKHPDKYQPISKQQISEAQELIE
jgi:hypothetical protein